MSPKELKNGDSQTKDEFKRKIMVLGDSGVGKTCFVDKFLHNAHFVNYGFEPEDKQRALEINGQPWTLEMLDINLTMICDEDSTLDRITFLQWFGESAGVVLLYDVTDKTSFEHVTNEGYLNVIMYRRQKTDFEGESLWYPMGQQRFGCVLVGTKADLAAEKREVDYEVAEEWAGSQGFRFFEMDSYSQGPIDEAMRALVKSIAYAERMDAEDLEEERRRMNGEDSEEEEDSEAST